MLAMAERKLTCGLEAGLCPVFLSFFYCGVADLPGNFNPKLSSEMYSGFIFPRV